MAILWKGTVSESPETMRKLCLSAKFPHQEIRWNYGTLRSVSASIPTKVLQIITKDICILLTDYINSSISNGQFQTQPKMTDAVSIFKKDSPFDKANYRLTSLLQSLPKVFQKTQQFFLWINYPLLFIISLQSVVLNMPFSIHLTNGKVTSINLEL